MIRKFLLIAIIPLISLEMNAQKLVIRMQSGMENIETLNTIQKLYFSGNELIIDFYSGTEDSYEISEIQKLYFDSTVSVFESGEAACNFSVFPNPAGKYIVVDGIPAYAEKLSIYCMDGSLVITRDVAGENAMIDISGLPDGLYLVNVQGFTSKFIKE